MGIEISHISTTQISYIGTTQSQLHHSKSTISLSPKVGYRYTCGTVALKSATSVTASGYWAREISSGWLAAGSQELKCACAFLFVFLFMCVYFILSVLFVLFASYKNIYYGWLVYPSLCNYSISQVVGCTQNQVDRWHSNQLCQLHSKSARLVALKSAMSVTLKSPTLVALKSALLVSPKVGYIC